MAPSEEWSSLSPIGKQMWIQAQMEADLTAFRGTPTVFNLDGTDPDVAFALANRYRELTGVDPKTAAWVDAVVTNKTAHTVGDELVKPTPAIAVAHPGTKHPGGIGPITNRKAIVLNEKHFMDNKTWAKEKAMSSSGSFPWSVGSDQGDYTATMVHEFGHHRQFRLLAETMLEAGQPFSKVRQPDGFGLMPDSSNWPEIQTARYDIQKLAPSQYGKSKTSEAFAEVWSGVVTGYVPISPELQSAWDTWHSGMEIPAQMPPDRFTPDELVDYESLTPEEQTSYWAEVSALLELPGMREHYPETASLFDAWVESQGGVPSVREIAEPGDVSARLQIRAKNYGGQDGFVITGTDTFGRRVSVFSPGSKEEAEQVRDRIKAGGPAFGEPMGGNLNERKLGNDLVMRLSDSSEGRGTIKVYAPDGEHVGTLHWNLSGISHLGVRPEFQRQGIATAMYRWARELDPDLLHGMVVSESARSWIDTLNPDEREQVGRPETKWLPESAAPAAMVQAPPEGTLVDFWTKGRRARGYVVGIADADRGENALLYVKSGNETIPRRVRNVDFPPSPRIEGEEEYTLSQWFEDLKIAMQPEMAEAAMVANPNERTAKFAEKIADWLPKWQGKQEAIGYNTKIVSRYTVLNDLLGKNLLGRVGDPKITAQDDAIVRQVQYIVESGITPEQLRRQAAELRKAST